jgi:cellulose synthase/poly-beta-1,6-N-acetylglucosamine synthase-like glycosyltransferase
MTGLELLFWGSLLFVGYVYVGYPLLALAASRLAPRGVAKGDIEPRVSLIVAVHNAREQIARKIDNCLELDYPPDKLEVVLSLDAPSDGTDSVVHQRHAADPRLRVVESPRHGGKAAALNRAMAVASGEIVVFCDARQRVDEGAVRRLVANFADPEVGTVSGELVLHDGEGRPAADGVGLYWRYEKALRLWESRVHSTVGATGALYAIRRELWQPLPAATILDDVVVPMRAVLAGRRTVFEPAARAFDRTWEPELEFRRKVRTLAGNFQLLALMPELLVPWRNPVFLQFLSHKVGRLLVPYFLVALFLSNLMLREGLYLATLAVQCLWYLAACGGALASRATRRPALDALPLSGRAPR